MDSTANNTMSCSRTSSSSDPRKFTLLCKAHELNIATKSQQLAGLLNDPKNHRNVVALKVRLDGTYSVFKELLEAFISRNPAANLPEKESAKLKFTALVDNMKRLDMDYRVYLQKCLSAGQSKVSQGLRSSRASKTASSSSTFRQAKLLQLEAAEEEAEAQHKMKEAEAQHKMTEAEAQLKLKKAQIKLQKAQLLIESSSSKASSRRSLRLAVALDGTELSLPPPQNLRKYVDPRQSTPTPPKPDYQRLLQGNAHAHSDPGMTKVPFDVPTSTAFYQSTPVANQGDQSGPADQRFPGPPAFNSVTQWLSQDQLFESPPGPYQVFSTGPVQESPVTCQPTQPVSLTFSQAPIAMRAPLPSRSTPLHYPLNPFSYPPQMPTIPIHPVSHAGAPPMGPAFPATCASLRPQQLLSTTRPRVEIPGPTSIVAPIHPVSHAGEPQTGPAFPATCASLRPQQLLSTTRPRVEITGPTPIGANQWTSNLSSLPPPPTVIHPMPTNIPPFYTLPPEPVMSTLPRVVRNNPVHPDLVVPHRPLQMRNPPVLYPTQAEMPNQLASKDDLYMLFKTMKHGFNVPRPDPITFDGDPKLFHMFMRGFDNMVDKNSDDPSAKLGLLISMCRNQAKLAIEHLIVVDPPSEAYRLARETLEYRFGSRTIVIEAHINQLTVGPQLHANDVQGHCALASQMRNCWIILKSWKAEGMLDAQAYLKNIFRRLPYGLQQDYAHDRSWRLCAVPSFQHLLDFIELRAHLGNTFYGRLLAERDPKPRATRPQNSYTKKAYTFSTVASTPPNKVESAPPSNPKPQDVKQSYDSTRHPQTMCVCCGTDHWLNQCKEFLEKDIDQRREFIQQNHLCFNCMRSGHKVEKCTSPNRCKAEGCNRRHNTLLHLQAMPIRKSVPPNKPADFNSKPDGASVSKTSTRVMSTLDSDCPVRFMVVPVEITDPISGETRPSNAFLDYGSNRSFLSTAFAKGLGITGKREKCTIICANDPKIHSGQRIDFTVRGISESRNIDVRNALTLESIPNVKDSIPTPEVVNHYPHLNGLEFPVVGANVDVLIGADVLGRYGITDTRVGLDGSPSALRTALGWALTGPDETLKSKCISVNFLNTTFSPSQHNLSSELNVPVCTICCHDFSDLNADPSVTLPSINDKRAVEIMNETVTRVDGRLQIGLLWKSDDVRLPYNFTVAWNRAMTLKRKFLKDSCLFTKYVAKINEYIDNGYAERIPEDELTPTNRTWFIPHHCTQQSKFRVVFDSSAEYKGTSLNKHLLSGPDFNNPLLHVLMRFRQEPVAFTSDIKQMYHRLKVPKPDSDSLRFFWWPDNDLTKPPAQYRMLSHIFGSICSPSVATFALRKVAEDNSSGADDVTLQTVRSNFYVDDCLKSVATLDEAVSLIRQLVEHLAADGFHLTKFMSNVPAVLDSVSEEDRATATNFNLEGDSLSKTLGINWNMTTDEFVVYVNIDAKEPTRRGILSMVSQVFDPLGLVQPSILPARQLLQDLCFEGYSWDDLVTGSFKDRWEKWTNTLTSLNGLAIPRCYKPHGFFPANIQLHCFSDASMTGYGACAYLRLVDSDGRIHVSFVKGNSRVTPRKSVTIPRLELTAAVVAAEMANTIKRELEYKIDSVHLWTDSMSVLQMIHNKNQRFKIFVANRLNTIHSLTRPDQWHHVSTKLNPADLASRGTMPDKFHRSDIWFNGPSFLCDDESSWNLTLAKNTEISDGSVLAVEVRVNFTDVNTSTETSSLSALLKRYSSFDRLRKATAWLLRFKSYMVWKFLRKGDPPSIGFLSVAELETSTNEIVRLLQCESLSTELAYFGDHTEPAPPLSKKQRRQNLKSPFAKALLKCNPFVHNSILRVGGRLLHSDLPFEQIHPIILPPYHHVTKLLVDMYHCVTGHSGTLHVLAALRERYWILRGQSAVSKALRQCLPCNRRSASVGKQWMADLPAPRVSSGHPPFYHCFVDYFGPIKVKLGRNQYKRYGCIFTCMATRAIHLEVAESLDTSAFLQAFSRFVDRRSCPGHMYSDNGGNFIAGSKALSDGIKAWNLKHINTALSQKGIQWHFSPPLASHQNGVVERMVREVKKILRNLTEDRSLTDYSLWTFLTGVESILNNRPLTRLSDDPRDLGTLSPNSILLNKLDSSLPPDVFMRSDEYRRGYRQVQRILDVFWERWTKEYLPLLQQRDKWQQPSSNLKTGDLVLMCDDITPRGQWPKAVIEESYPDKHGLVRRVKVRTSTNSFVRDVRKLCLLEIS